MLDGFRRFPQRVPPPISWNGDQCQTEGVTDREIIPPLRYVSIRSDPARECLGGDEMQSPRSLRIETFEGSRSCLEQTRVIIGM
jgi:hypothetical protein